MGRTKNQIESVPLPITTTQRVIDDLELLAATGYFGKNKNEAAEQILRTELRRILTSGELDGLAQTRKKTANQRKRS